MNALIQDKISYWAEVARNSNHEYIALAKRGIQSAGRYKIARDLAMEAARDFAELREK